MSGLRRLSDTALGGGLAGATSGQVPVFNSTTGHATPGTPPLNSAFSGYNLTPSSMRKFRAAMALAKTGGTNAHIICYGDSITGGVGATSAFSTSWVARLRNLIDAKMGSTRGTGFIPIFNGTITGNPSNTQDSRLVLSGTVGSTWGGYANYGPLANASAPFRVTNGGIWYVVSNATPATLTLGPVTADQFTVYYWRIDGTGGSNVAGASWNVTIDGSAPSSGGSTLSCNGTLAVLNASFAPASQGSHTFVLSGPTSGSTVPTCIGVEARANGSTGGVRVSAIGYGGLVAQAFNNGTLGAVAWGQLQTEFDMLAPDLSIIMLETNDSNSNNNTSITNYKTYVQNLIDRAKLTGDVLLCTTVPQGSTIPSPIPLSSYTQALYDLADANNIGLADIAARYGAYGTSPAFYSDTYHPNDKGHQDIAAAVYQSLAYTGVGL